MGDFTVIFEDLDSDTEEYIRQTANAMAIKTRKAYHRLEIDMRDLEQLKALVTVVILAQESA